MELHPVWVAKDLLAGAFIDVEDLVDAVDAVLSSGTSLAMSSVMVEPRRPVPPLEERR